MAEEYRLAAWYDPLLGPALRNLRTGILRFIVQGGYSSVIDVCCGTGNQLRYLQEAGIPAVGIDLSEHMLRVSSGGKKPVRCFQQDATRIDFRDGSFDLAMSTLALHEKSAETARVMIREMIRVTGRDGHLLLADFDFNDRSWMIARAGVRAIERMAGGDHYENFRRYIKAGGLQELVAPFDLQEIHCAHYALNTISMRVYKA